MLIPLHTTKTRLTQMASLRGAKRNKSQIQQCFQHISNTQVFYMLEKTRKLTSLSVEEGKEHF